MARVLLAWEMGANFGHIDRLRSLAEELRAQGHEPFLVVRDLARVHGRLVRAGFRVGQAPVWLPRLVHPPRLGNYSAVLASAGWLDAEGLAGLVTAWRSWFALLQADVLVCDHAPTALLAARGQGFPVWYVGSSFAMPPTGAGSFPPFPGAAQADCPTFDAQVLPSVQAALRLLGDAPLQNLPDIFSGAARVLTTLPALAHYTGYGAEVHWTGPTFVAHAGADPVWPEGPGVPVLVYLDAAYPGLDAVLDALKAQGCRVLLYAKGLSPAAVARHQSPSLFISPTPVRMDLALARAALVVSHGGQGTVAATALAGLPHLILPQHAEQAMSARRVAEAGLGLALHAGSGPDVAALLKRLVREARFGDAAQAFARAHQHVQPQGTAQAVVALMARDLGARTVCASPTGRPSP
jgi:UDP:flavonoid glycosyltransferase YjiC (YdhE family)